MGKPFVVLRFSLVFFVTSLLFTLLSWDRIEPHHELEVPIKSGPEPLWILDQYGLLGMVLHASMHVLVGCMIASLSRRPDIIIASGIVALLIDVDHIGLLLGVPTVFRASHSFGFMVLVAVVMGLLASSGFLGRRAPPLLVGAVAAASVSVHTALDAIITELGSPLWAPLSFKLLELTSLSAVALLGTALMLVLAASVFGGRKKASP